LSCDPPPSSPWRILCRALLWLLAAEVAAYAVSFLVAFVLAVAHTAAYGKSGWQPSPLVYALPATVALQAILLIVDFREGRLRGHGNLAAGLGAAPVRRPRLIAFFLVLMIAWVLSYITLLIHFQSVATFIAHDVPPTPVLRMTGAPALIVIRILLIAALAPLAEELFFRGWLWTALRRTWDVWPTALCSSGIWLALHALEGAVRVPILVPAAILLSLARHHGGSVRASIPIHVANNLTAVAIQLVAMAAG
jgi:membrane protease YdiL (CAAX protease family)